ncbi:unnamed protein product [Chrysodeixis includens]|uniref:Androgen-dependent TFPI-regulating protein-like n=1 Tax=Chrysodeixis includens TaxID=689277 RepID=A0A9P0BXA0_CHRIL|nr:unnamed protein product [Chrysodeixis includens]
MGAVTHHIYFRILAYVTTIAMHMINMTIMMSSFHGEHMNNYYVRHFNEMQFFFFTCWTFIFQTVHAVIGLTSDILTLKNSNNVDYKLPKYLENIRDGFFSIFVWPATILVFLVFWSFFHFDRSLLFPKDIDLVITDASNHIMHTYILPATLWEVMFRPQKPPRNHTWHLLCVLMVEAVYISVLLFVHATRGVWVYPIFGILMGSIYFPLFFVAVAAMLAIIYYSQWAFNSMIWEPKEKTKKVY